MLRITDARSGETVDAAPVRRGLTRVEAHVTDPGPGALRVLLVADLLVRTLELGGTPVWGLLTEAPGQPADPGLPALRAAGAALGMRPFEDSRDIGLGLGEVQVVHVAAEGAETPDGVRVADAPVHLDGAGGTAFPDPARDPAAVRLALLSPPRDAPARLDTAVLDAAHDTLVRWRRAVAGWAAHPSRPVPDAMRTRLRSAWEDDLDVPEVLRVLALVEGTGGLADGARFETYAYADRLLGLDLTLGVGAGA
ncbi:hypothetical protein ABTX35_29450 [Streptomyces sp. NPDC096080]|uniref:hypothetical protein n=1 Tax=Streptomyces sp. NPDC096080 TaxID=3156693 RepID=UPI00331F1A2A